MKRDLFPKLSNMIDCLEDNRVILVEGARQVGKTYLVHDVLKALPQKKICFDLEKDRVVSRQIAKTEDANDLKALLKDQHGLKENTILFFDEAQECRKLSGYIKSFKEDWHAIKVILTGSSMNRFFSDQERIPVGRTQSICVFGFNFPEFLRYVKGAELAEFIHSAPHRIAPSRHEYLLGLFDQYMHIGGYPEAIKAFAAEADPREVIEEITASLEEDFARKEPKMPNLFRHTLEGIANNIGSPSKYSQINANMYQAKKIVSAMKAWHLILEVKPQSLNPLHSNFLPKRYLHDLGVVNLLRAQPVPNLSILNSLAPLLRTPLGGLFENAVLINLLCGKPTKKSIYTWKKNSKTSIEVDFILALPGMQAKIPVECKACLTLKRQHFANILQYLRSSHQTVGLLISGAPYQVHDFDDNIKIINLPIYLVTEPNIIKYIGHFTDTEPS